MIVNTGLGDLAKPITTGINASGAATVAILTQQAATIGTGASMFGVSAAIAIPVIGAAIAGVSLVVGLWLSKIARQNSQKTATTSIVNEAEPILEQNVNAYLSTPTHTAAEKVQALRNFDDIWGQVVAACSSGQFDSAGERCVSDRSKGGKWDWFSYYRDPIANSTTLSVSQTAKREFSEFTSGFTALAESNGINPDWVLWGVASIAAVWILGRKS